MATDLVTFKKVTLPNSITNPNIERAYALDGLSPFTFYDFLKFSKEVITPQEYNITYQNYLQTWYKLKDNTDQEVFDNIRERYIELLKDISLNYTTAEEKRFLSNIDLTNPNDTAIAIPFYSRKLFEICQFYIDKRDKLTFQLEKNKIKGNNSSIKNAIFEEIIDYVFQNDYPVDFKVFNTPLSAVANNLNVETEELFDFYNNYFDIDPTFSSNDYDVNTKERQDYFTSNVNDINADLFINFDKALKNAIFSGLVFLKELGNNFSINFNTDNINLNCKPQDKLFQFITENKAGANRLLLLQKQLIEKYIGTDFYYLSTGQTTTDVNSGKLFEAKNPSGNLLNRHFPSTATVPELSQLESIRQFGLFFTPDKLGLLYFSYPEKKYVIDYSKLEPNKVYIFPDPALYGNTTGLTRNIYEYPLIQIIDHSTSVNNQSLYYAEGDVKITPYTQSFYGYYSVGQINNSSQTGISGLNVNFNNLYNRGIITNWKSDIYGNQFGIFKQKARKNYTETLSIQPKCIILDGWKLYDDMEGYNFNYSLTGEYYNDPTTIRTGLTSYGPSLTATDYAYTMYFRELLPYEECPVGNRCSFLDGASFTFNNGSLLPESYSTDLTAWPGNANNTLYFYNSLYDAGIGDVDPFTHAVSGNPALSGDFTFSYVTSSGDYLLVDCYTFLGNQCKITNDYDYTYKSSNYVDTVIESSKTVFSSNTATQDDMSLYDYTDLDGQAFVRNVGTNTVSPISAALNYILTKYSNNVQTEVSNNIKALHVHNNFIFIETLSYLIIDKLVYKELEFVAPNTPNTVINISTNEPCADPFIFENENYSIVVKLSGYNTNSNNVAYFPIIYKYDYASATLNKLYPINTTTIETLTSLFGNTIPVKIDTISKPVLTYNSRNLKFNISFTGNDQNDMSYIYSITFTYKGNAISIEDVILYNISNTSTVITYNMYDTPNFTAYGLLSTAPIAGSFISINQPSGAIEIYG